MKSVRFIFILAGLILSMFHSMSGQSCDPQLTSVNIINRDSFCLTHSGDFVELEVKWAMSGGNPLCVAPTGSWRIQISLPPSFVYKVNNVLDVVTPGPFTWTYDGINNVLRGINNLPVNIGSNGVILVNITGDGTQVTACNELSSVVNIEIVSLPSGSPANFDNIIGNDFEEFDLEVRAPLDVTPGTIASCYPDLASAEAAAIAATIVVNQGGCDYPDILKVANTVGTCSAVITVTVTNECGDEQIFVYNTRIDDTDPVFTCLTAQTKSTDVGQCTYTIQGTELDALAIDNCSGAISYSYVLSGVTMGMGVTTLDGIVLNKGVTTVTWTATDNCGNESSCQFNVTINDNEAPVITYCPPAVMVSNPDDRDPYATGMATASDNCSGVVVSFTEDRTGLSTIDCRATGPIVRTFIATDLAGNVNLVPCVQTITVEDDTNPVIAPCPSDIVASAEAGLCTAIVTFAAPTAIDTGYFQGFEDPAYFSGANVSASSDWNNYNSVLSGVATGTNGIASKTGTRHGEINSNGLVNGFGGVFSRLGGYTNEFGLGYKTKVDVYIDLTNPAVGANTYGFDISSASSNQAGGHLRDFVFHVSAIGGAVYVNGTNNTNYAKRNDLHTLVPSSHVVGSSGWYTFEWVFRDNGGVLAVDMNLYSSGGGAPVWTTTRTNPADLIASVVGGNRYMWFTTVQPAGLLLPIDDSYLDRNVPVSCSLPSGSAFPVGTTVVTCTATDNCGNESSCQFNVTINDNEAPVITYCPPAVMVSNPDDRDPYATGMATASDNCSGVVVSFTEDRTGLSTIDCRATGPIVRTFIATDPAGNVNLVPCVQTITVEDDTNPVIAPCPSDIVASAEAGLCTAIVTFAAPTAIDTGYFQGFEDPAYFSGANVSASSDWNNYNSVLSGVATGTNGIASKTGTRHGEINSNGLVNGFGGVFSRLGGYTNEFGLGYKTKVDVYIDLTNPAVGANTYGFDISSASSNQAGGHLRDFVFHVSAIGGAVYVNGTNNTNYAKRNDLHTLVPSSHVVGSSGWYTFEWVFRDNGGVLAVDMNLYSSGGGAPVWTTTRTNPADLIASVVGGNRYMWFTTVQPAGLLLPIDDSYLDRNVPVSCSLPSGSAFPVGTTVVTCTATDNCGNESSCQFNVTINDNEAPVITYCPPAVMVSNPDDRDPYATGMATASDNCSGVVVSFTEDRTGLSTIDCRATGPIVRTFIATDPAGNVNLVPCVQTITVEDDTNPVIAPCPSDIVASAEAGLCTAIVTFAAPTAIDTGYFQGFEDPAYFSGANVSASSDWNNYNSVLSGVATGTNGIASKTGTRHGEINSNGLVNGFGGVFSRLGGYTNEFGLGYKTKVDVYIDLTNPAVGANTYGFDISSASSNQAGGHLRDFVFHVSAIGGAVYVNGTNNTNYAKRNDLHTLVPSSHVVGSSGWYTFEWVFRDNGGVLAVDMNLYSSGGGAPVWTTTRTNPADLIASVVGGNRYMWFTTVQPAGLLLPIDDSYLDRNVPVSCSLPSGSAFPVGTTVVTCTATDNCGNESSCQFNVTINDNEAPVITYCPPAVMVSNPDDRDPYATGMATASDNCSGVVVSFTEDRTGLSTIDCRATGPIVRTFIATDLAGNVNLVPCVQTITVEDDTNPVIAPCPSDIVASAEAGLCTAIVTFAAPTAIDTGYFQGFEDPAYFSGANVSASSDWNNYNSVLSGVATGTNGIASKTGTRHGEINSNGLVNGFGGVFSRLGGYTNEFGLGYKTKVDVYIDLTNPAVGANTYGFDISSASSNQAGGHLRDFVFHVSAIGGAVYVNGTNNTNYAKRNDLHTLVPSSHVVGSSGWYTFEWVFRDNGGVLAVDMNLYSSWWRSSGLDYHENKSGRFDCISSWR
ncbi:MAG: HYR domain-containing protein [Saprospiraceae bacterium]|nr:HYR domain-containing protein [Saprospiraceae bacterium]